MGRGNLAVRQLDRAWLDRVEPPFAGVEIGDDTAPAAKPVFHVAGMFRMGVNALAVGLPGFQHHVLDRRAHAIDDDTFHTNALTLGIGACDIPAQFLPIDVETGGAWREADMNVRSGRLGRRFLQIVELLRHDQFPSGRFSNRVERRPRRTMSNL